MKNFVSDNYKRSNKCIKEKSLTKTSSHIRTEKETSMVIRSIQRYNKSEGPEY